jgi:hypothetical protein
MMQCAIKMALAADYRPVGGMLIVLPSQHLCGLDVSMWMRQIIISSRPALYTP